MNLLAFPSLPWRACTRTLAAFLVASAAGVAGETRVQAHVVINELMYHAPDDRADVEFIELHNPEAAAVDLGGWSLGPAVDFKFPAGARLEGKGFLVLTSNAEKFREFYDAPVAGTYRQRLSNRGERLRLTNARGEVVDAIQYAAHPPWPEGAQGESGSLERICPAASGEDAANWISSPLAPDRDRPMGTPGKVNAGYSATLPATIASVTYTPMHPAADQPVEVDAVVRGGEGALKVRLLYRLVVPGAEKPEIAVAMQPRPDDATRYHAVIPGSAAEQLLRFRVEAVDARGARRLFPAETEPHPALSGYVHGSVVPTKIPQAWILHTTESELKLAQQMGGGGPGPGGFNPAEMMRFQVRMILGLGVDLPGLWSELSQDPALTPELRQKLRPVFVAQSAKQAALIEKTSDEPGEIDQKMRRLPELAQSTRESVATEVESLLPTALKPRVAAWREAGRNFGGPGMMVRQMVDLDGGWYALTVQAGTNPPAELAPADFEKLRQSFAILRGERQALIQTAPELMRQDNGFEKISERVGGLQEKINKVVETEFPSAQKAAWEQWEESRGMGFGPRRAGRSSKSTETPDQYRSALVYFDPATSEWRLFDFVRALPRSGGWKVKLGPAQSLLGMTSMNFIFEYNDRFVLAEPLAYELYRRAGLGAEQSFHVRLTLNGQPQGYQLLVEQPNRAFLRRIGRRDDGNLYKIIWQDQTVVGGHEKKTHVHDGHDDVVALIAALEKTSGDAAAQWKLIQDNFEVEQVATYFAVNMVLSHWDGYFNNYFTYHDTKGTKKWSMYPWDQDKTWGFHDGLSPGEVFTDMPLTFGMEGDVPPGMEGRPRSRRSFPFGGGGGAAWWRQGGFFSRPLLANPQFRQVFLKHTRDILEKVYTPETFFPLIEAMGARLQDEVRERARVLKQDPEEAVGTLRFNLESLRQHLTKRREFLLAQPELAKKTP